MRVHGRLLTTISGIILASHLILASNTAWSADLNTYVKPYVQSPTSSSIIVSFERSSGTATPVVEYRLKGSAANYNKVNMQLKTGTEGVYHATLSGLAASTLYEYRVLQDTNSSPNAVFKTWPKVGSPTKGKFILVSDTQFDWANSNKIFTTVINKVIKDHCGGIASNCANNIDGILVAGDVTQSGTEHQWRNEFFANIASLIANVPVILVPGNHDQLSDFYLNRYSAYFTAPTNGSNLFNGQWYTLQFGRLKIIGLNSNPTDTGSNGHIFNASALTEQKNWLNNQLASAKTDNNVGTVLAFFHHPCLSELWRVGETLGSCDFVSALEDFSNSSQKISGHLFGHTHAYSRGQSMFTPHFWLNSASASGGLEDTNDTPNLKDYNNFETSRNEFGVAVLDLNSQDTEGLNLSRYSLVGVDKNFDFNTKNINEVAFTLVDSQKIQPGISDLKINITPQNIEMTALGVKLKATVDRVISNTKEIAWQFSKNPNFSGQTFEVWGNDTRVNNTFLDAQGNLKATNVGDAILTVNAGELASSAPIYEKGDEYYRLQKPFTFQSEFYNRPTPIVPAKLTFLSNEVWYVRAKVRDDKLRWSDWSNDTRFTVSPESMSDNLIINGGAENGMNNWTINKGTMQSIFPSQNANTAAYADAKYFVGSGFGATSNEVDEMYQDIDLTAYQNRLSNGAYLKLSGAMRGWEGQKDAAILWAEFLDSSGNVLASTKSLTNSTPIWTVLENTSNIPVGTAKVRVYAKAFKIGAYGDNDGYFDDIKAHILFSNLVANAGAEKGMTDWNVDFGLPQSINPSQNDNTLANSGNRYFVGGGFGNEEFASNQMFQELNTQAFASLIKAGNAKANLSGYMRGWAGQTDKPYLWIEFLDANKQVIGKSTQLSNYTTQWEKLANTTAIPAHTKFMRVYGKMERAYGSDTDGYIDDINLYIQ